MNSYQRLKDRNKQLIDDIYSIVYGKGEPKHIKGEITEKWRLKFQMEEAEMYGEANHNDNELV
jgi:hypothetical protein